MRTNRRNAFTLIEVLIVVVIMAVLAATIIPQFSNSAKDAKEGSLKFNIHTLRSQVELYKMHHLGNLPTGANNLEQLTKQTKVDGTVNTGASDPVNFPYGPYIQLSLPVQPFSGVNTVKTYTGTPTPTAGIGGGWLYNTDTGEIRVDHTDYYSNPAF